MRHRIIPFALFAIFFSFHFSLFTLFLSCSKEEATELERINAEFLDSLGTSISTQHWWKTAVALKINVTTDEPVKLWLMGQFNGRTYLYDYKELSGSGSVTMTVPQGQATSPYIRYLYKNKLYTYTVSLSGKPEEFIQIDATSPKKTRRYLNRTPPASLCGSSIKGDAKYYQFDDDQLNAYFEWRATNDEKVDAKEIDGQICNYELESNGPFYITWVTGNEAEQRSHILGYYYHSPYTYDDIKYVDLSETHKWDYIDGLAKVQYQIKSNTTVDGQTFYANTWYDANFDMSDKFGATTCYNMDRVGDDAYNMFAMYTYYGRNISALRGISFKIDVPEDTRVGFYLRADEEPLPEQWSILKNEGIRPYVSDPSAFMGTNFCNEKMNIDGNGLGKHRSFIKDFNTVYWMGMEDLLNGGDHDCNDVIFGVVSDLRIWMPDIVEPTLKEQEPDPGPDPGTDPDPQHEEPEDAEPFPWTIAYEDVGRNADFDFNDAVIKIVPDYENERCCVYVEAAGSPSRMYLHYDGPDGDQTLGEMHELLGSNQQYINTMGALASSPFVLVDCVPWPKDYTVSEDAQRFYIEIQRGSCNDCSDVITLALEPGKMPEAMLIAGEWQWPMEGVNVVEAFDDFPGWAHDPTRTRYWEWYKNPDDDKYVAY